jgi:hypothetical protein
MSHYIVPGEEYEEAFLRKFIDDRNLSVHHFHLEVRHYWGAVEHIADPEKRLAFNAEKFHYPGLIIKHLSLFAKGFLPALNLIDALPDKVLIFIKRRFSDDEKTAAIISINHFEGPDLMHLFKRKHYIMSSQLSVRFHRFLKSILG